MGQSFWCANDAHYRSRCPVRVISTFGFAQATWNSRIRTTAYHPRAMIGMIERFHRHLKGSLKATEQTCHWSEAVSLILLSIRTTVKTDLACSPAELVYVTALSIPGEFVHSSPPATDTSSYVQRLKATLQCLHPTPVAHHLAADQSGFVPKDLFTACHVFLRYDGGSKPLQHPYDGPYRVLKRSQKYLYSLVAHSVTLCQSTASLQRSLNSLYEWGQRWRIRFEPSKTQHLIICRRRTTTPDPILAFGNVPIETTDKLKLPGKTFDPTLSFRPHLHNLAVRANRRLAFLRKAGGGLLLLLLLFTFI